MDLGAMAIKGVLRLSQRLTIRLFSVITGHFLGKDYLSAEMQSVNTTTPVDWSLGLLGKFWFTRSPLVFRGFNLHSMYILRLS